MGILSIKIKNFKSLKNVYFDFSNKYDAFCILGENGAGKSNFLDSIKYFYEKLTSQKCFSNNVLDKVNTYSQKMQIEVVYDLKPFSKFNSNPYLNDMIKLLKNYTTTDSQIAIKLVQYRSGELKWFPDNYKVRHALSKLFPLYMIDTRFISLQEWSKLWEVMAELSISKSPKKPEQISQLLDNCFEDIYNEKYIKSMNRIQEILFNEQIYINDKDYKAKFMNALQLRLGGNEFMHDGNNLHYNSDGINSLKYTKLFLHLVSSLAETGWKNPLIILDEPEIGLHMSYIDELVDCISAVKSKFINIAFSTHSTYLVAKLIKNDLKVCVDRIFNHNNYSHIERMRDIVNDADKYIISTRETECYFAKGIVFVEGKTEFQVFQNPRIQELFPQLKQLHFYQSSDGTCMKIIDPSNAKYTVPYLIISDMDKILKYKDNHFQIKEDTSINPLFMKNISHVEKYLYYHFSGKKSRTYGMRKEILKLLHEKEFHISDSQYWLDSAVFDNLLSCIQRYCYEYRVYPVLTTIEGCLINSKNLDYFINWYVEKFPNKAVKLQKNLCDFTTNTANKTLFLRLLANGKTDFLMTKKEADNLGFFPQNFASAVDLLCVGNKVNGWINEFFDYIFIQEINSCNDPIAKKEKFAKLFPELNTILQILCNMI
jgi:hypothetical protein